MEWIVQFSKQRYYGLLFAESCHYQQWQSESMKDLLSLLFSIKQIYLASSLELMDGFVDNCTLNPNIVKHNLHVCPAISPANIYAVNGIWNSSNTPDYNFPL